MPAADKTLVLVDALAAIYRAFFAIKSLSTKDGRPTNAVFGFIRALKQIEQEWRPSHMAVVYDGGLPERRLSLLPSYKAQRPHMPDEMREQLAVTEEYLDAAGIARIRIDREEADDVMASLAEWGAAGAERILIASSDKDLFQLVGSNVRMIAPSAKAGETIGVEEIESKTGVLPEHVVEWLALVGDSSDNIPGVPGVGAKTAAKLLKQFGSLAGLWDRLDEVSSDRIRNVLAESRATVERNVRLVTLERSIDCDVTWHTLARRPASHERLLALFEELEFERMARELREPSLF